MRVGTLECLLFGHKFKATDKIVNPDKEYPDGFKISLSHIQVPYCVRCGIDKELKNDSQN